MPTGPYTCKQQFFNPVIHAASVNYPVGFLDAPNLYDLSVFDSTTGYSLQIGKTGDASVAAVWGSIDGLVQTVKGHTVVTSLLAAPDLSLYYSSDNGLTWTLQQTLVGAGGGDFTFSGINKTEGTWMLWAEFQGNGVVKGTFAITDLRLYDGSGNQYIPGAVVSKSVADGGNVSLTDSAAAVTGSVTAQAAADGGSVSLTDAYSVVVGHPAASHPTLPEKPHTGSYLEAGLQQEYS